jgi:hypothetical protein
MSSLLSFRGTRKEAKVAGFSGVRRRVRTKFGLEGGVSWKIGEGGGGREVVRWERRWVWDGMGWGMERAAYRNICFFPSLGPYLADN